MPKTKMSAVLSLLLVLLSGSVLGAFVYRLYLVDSVHTTGGGRGRPSPEELRHIYVSEVTKAVKLDPEEVTALKGIMDQAQDEVEKLNAKIRPERDALREKWRPEREAIQKRQVDRINAILRPDQRPLFDSWRDSWRAERDRQRKLNDQQRQAH